MKLEDLLEEKHVDAIQKLIDAITKTVKEEGCIPHPFFFVLTKEDRLLHNIPITDFNVLNSVESKQMLDTMISKFIDLLGTDEGVTPYGFGMITEVWYRKISKAEDLEEAVKNIDSSEGLGAKKFENIRNEAVNIRLNTINGDYHYLLDIIRSDKDNFAVGEPEVVITSKEKREEHKKDVTFFREKFNYF